MLKPQAASHKQESFGGEGSLPARWPSWQSRKCHRRGEMNALTPLPITADTLLHFSFLFLSYRVLPLLTKHLYVLAAPWPQACNLESSPTSDLVYLQNQEPDFKPYRNLDVFPYVSGTSAEDPSTRTEQLPLTLKEPGPEHNPVPTFRVCCHFLCFVVPFGTGFILAPWLPATALSVTGLCEPFWDAFLFSATGTSCDKIHILFLLCWSRPST